MLEIETRNKRSQKRARKRKRKPDRISVREAAVRRSLVAAGKLRGPKREKDSRSSGRDCPPDETYEIPPAAKKAAMVQIALQAFARGQLDPKQLPQVRGRDVDEDGFARALQRSTSGEVEVLIRPLVSGRCVRVQGKLGPAARGALEALGAGVEELRNPDEKWYIDMTPFVFVLAAVMMAVRYISLGLGDKGMYIFAGVSFAVIYGFRVFAPKLQRPAER